MTALDADLVRDLSRHLRLVCRSVGIDPAGAELIKYTINAVYRLPPYVVRMNRGGHDADRGAARLVATATALARFGLPTIRLADVGPQPVDLAAPARAIHAVSTVDVDLTPWGPIAKARRRVNAAVPDSLAELGLGADALLTSLHERCDRLERELADIRWHLLPGLVHGDVHTGNLLIASTGPVLCDLDAVCAGPREWDLTPVAHGATRFGRPRADYDAFAEAYGFDIMAWRGWATMRAIRDLQCATSTLGTFAGRPEVASQLAHRLRTLDDENAVWTRHT
jgi:hypothetical protein